MSSEPVYYTPSKIVYENRYDFSKAFEGLNRTYVGLGSWFAIGVFTYYVIHPLAVVVPVWFFCGTIMNFIIMRRYFKKLITKVEFSYDMNELNFTCPFNS